MKIKPKAQEPARDIDPYSASRFSSVAERDDAWIAEAISYTASIFKDRANRTEFDLGSLVEAGCRALLMEHASTNGRKALVYAVTARGHATVVPRERWMEAVDRALAAVAA